jgi:cell division septation protein DedD
VVQYITNLLLIHDCVIIPNFGGFVGSSSSAELNTAQHIVSPPYKKIAFNINLSNNDGLLANYIAKQKQVSFTEANIEIIAFVEGLKQTLKREKQFAFSGIGLFKIDTANTIRFEPSNSINFLLEAYGLHSVQSPTIKRDKLTRKAEVNKPIDRPAILAQPKSIKSIIWKSAIALPFVAIGLFVAFQGNVLKDIHNSYSSFNPFNSTSLAKKEVLHALTTPSVIAQKALDTNEKTAVAISSAAISSNEYYIIAGCFKNLSNATKLVAELKSQGYNASLHGERKGLHVVSYGSFSNSNEAHIQLKQIKASNADAWVLSN